MKPGFPPFVLMPWPIIALASCASPLPLAVPCPDLPPVSMWMMAPSRNAFLTTPLSKMPPKTLKSSPPGRTGAD